MRTENLTTDNISIVGNGLRYLWWNLLLTELVLNITGGAGRCL